MLLHVCGIAIHAVRHGNAALVGAIKLGVGEAHAGTARIAHRACKFSHGGTGPRDRPSPRAADQHVRPGSAPSSILAGHQPNSNFLLFIVVFFRQIAAFGRRGATGYRLQPTTTITRH